MTPTIHPFHLGPPGKRRLHIAYEPGVEPVGSVLVAPAFAEEMNRSRRMVALLGQALAASGYATLVPDLTGTGDSDGDFEDGDWTRWQADLAEADVWRRQAYGGRALWLGVRAGALLAAASARAGDQLLMWQPVSSGKTHLNQFLRLRIAADALAVGKSGTTTAALVAELDAGTPVEVAGYMISPSLARGLGSATLSSVSGTSLRIDILEVGAEAGAECLPATEASIESLRRTGARVTGRRVAGPAFWSSLETVNCPALIDATCEVIRSEPIELL